MIFFDTETEPFDRAYLAPEPICMSWAPGPDFELIDNCTPLFTSWLEGQQVLCGVHIAYDMAVLGEYWPDLLPSRSRLRTPCEQLFDLVESE